MAPIASSPRPTPNPADRPRPPSDAAVRIVYQAVRTFVPAAGVVVLTDLLAVTRLDPGTAAAAMNRLVRCGPFAVSRHAVDGQPVWHVRRTDR